MLVVNPKSAAPIRHNGGKTPAQASLGGHVLNHNSQKLDNVRFLDISGEVDAS
jgi:hypothetical protein